MKYLGIIPARAGSERVKNKNIRKLDGKPLISYTIEAALESELLDRVIVSTDSDEIARVASDAGAEVPFLRPKEISTKDSTEYQFHQHALDWIEKEEGISPEFLINLYPTSPFRGAETIDKALRLINENPEADGLRSVIKCSEHPYKMWKKSKEFLDYFVDDDDPSVHTLSYHLLPEVFIQNASVYAVKSEVVKKNKTTIGNKILAFEMDEYESVDINSELDFKFAEFLKLGRY